jgi:hypothetical protein
LRINSYLRLAKNTPDQFLECKIERGRLDEVWDSGVRESVRQGVRDDEVTGGVTLRQGRSYRTQEGGRGLGWELGKKID